MIEQTLTIIKPNAVKNGDIGNIINIIENNKYDIIDMKFIKLEKKLIEDFYLEHKDQVWYDKLVNFMISDKILIVVLEKENAIKDYRKLVGDINKPSTIRYLYGLNETENAVHGSDSIDSAKREIDFFFKK